MPTFIDSLLISLEIDPDTLNKSQKNTLGVLRSIKVEAKETGESIEKSTAKAADSIGRVTRAALGLFGVLIGGRGIKEFVADLTASDAALGRLSTNLGTTPQILNAWQLAAERAGGMAEATAQTMGRIAKMAYDFRTNNTPPPQAYFMLSALSKDKIDLRGSSDEIMSQMAKAASDVANNKTIKNGRQLAYQQLLGMGVDEGTANSMLQHGSNYGAYLRTITPITADKGQTDTAAKFQNDLTKSEQTWESVGRNFVNFGQKVLDPMINDLTRFGEEINRITKGLSGLGDWIAGMEKDHPEIKTAMEAGVVAGTAATGWAGARVVRGIVRMVRGVPTAGAAGGAEAAAGEAAAGAGLFSIPGLVLTAIAGYLTGDAIANTVKSAGAGEDAAVHKRNQDYYNSMRGWVNGGKKSPKTSSTTEDMIRAHALGRGIDPEVAVAVWKHEGKAGYVGDDSSSFGPFQLHYGNISNKYPHRGLGDQFTKDTGLNARDQSSIPQQIAWVMSYVRQHGWGDWSGAKAAGIYGKTGVGKPPWMQWASQGGIHIQNLTIPVSGASNPDVTAHRVVGVLRRIATSGLANYGTT